MFPGISLTAVAKISSNKLEILFGFLVSFTSSQLLRIFKSDGVLSTVIFGDCLPQHVPVCLVSDPTVSSNLDLLSLLNNAASLSPHYRYSTVIAPLNLQTLFCLHSPVISTP